MDCDLYMGKVGFKKYALYANANLQFKVNGRLLESNSYLLQNYTDDSNIRTSDDGVSQNGNLQVDANTRTNQKTVQSSECSGVESQIPTSEQSSDHTQQIDACVGGVKDTNVIGASSSFNNSNDMSSQDVNNMNVIEGETGDNCKSGKYNASGDDISTIGASDPEQEVVSTYSISAELVDVINEKEGNSSLVLPQIEADEGTTIPENVTEQMTDTDMLSDLGMEIFANIPDKTYPSANAISTGNMSANVESNVNSHELDRNDDIHHNDDIQDKKKEQVSRENESDDNTCQDVNMEMQDTAYGDLQDNGKATENKGNVHECERHDRLYDIFQHDSEAAGNDSSNEQDIAKDAEVINDRREHNSNENAVNSIELNVSAGITDDDDADSQKTLDLDDLDKQDVSSLHSSDVDLDLDADDSSRKTNQKENIIRRDIKI